jgi:ketosteroid isomerase-like protein
MGTVTSRLLQAMNAHDAAGMSSVLADDYQSGQPLHPNRAFSGRAQMLENWTSVFDGVPDFNAELLAQSVDGDTEWGEWEWRGHHPDGSLFLMRGITIFVVRDGLVTEGRLYMEPVEANGADIETSVQKLYSSAGLQTRTMDTEPHRHLREPGSSAPSHHPFPARTSSPRYRPSETSRPHCEGGASNRRAGVAAS